MLVRCSRARARDSQKDRMLRRRTVALACVLAIGVLAAPRAAIAQTVYCRIQRTADGFVALRTGPTTSARIIARMRPGDEVVVINDQPAGRAWTEVLYWGRRVPYDRRPPFQQGFVYARYLVNCDA
jgi:hypothetical protein